MPPPDSYAKLIREHIESDRNAAGRPLSLREFAVRVGKSYEHCRKLLSGQPVASKALNAKIAELIAVDADELWSIALREKAAKRYGAEVLQGPRQEWDDELQKAWEGLNDEQQRSILRVMDSMIEGNLRGRKPRKAD